MIALLRALVDAIHNIVGRRNSAPPAGCLAMKSKLDPAHFFHMIDGVIQKHTHIKIVATR